MFAGVKREGMGKFQRGGGHLGKKLVVGKENEPTKEGPTEKGGT